MNKADKVKYMQETQKYIEDKQIMDIFENLTQELIINQPSNPIQYLIQKLKSKQLLMHQQIYSVIGGSLAERKGLIEKVNKYGEFTVVNVEDHLLQGTQYTQELYFLNQQHQVSDTLLQQVKAHQKVILQGYPYDLKTSYHLQKSGIIPTKIFVISNNKQQVENNIQKYIENNSHMKIVQQSKQPVKQEKEEEVDIDLNDKDVQSSAALIQKQYRRKQQLKKEQEMKEREKKKKEEEEIDIDLNDQGVQNSAALIQKQYRRKQQKKREQEKKEKERKRKEEEEEIDIDLNDKGVQNSAALIQKQYRRKQQMKKEQEKKEKERKKKEEEEIDIDLNDKGVQNSAALIQKQYRRKQQKKQEQEKKEKERKKKEEKKRQQKKEEVDIDLNDKDVQASTLMIQKQYLRKKQLKKEKKAREEKNEQVILYAYTYLNNIQEVQKANQDMHTCIEANEIERVCKIISLRNKEEVPLRSLRLVVVRPSHLKRKVETVVAGLNQTLDLARVGAWGLVQHQIKHQTQIGHFCHQATLNHQRVPDDIVSALIFNQLNHVKARKNGFCLEGFPKTSAQFNIFNSWKIVPHLLLVFDDQPQVLHQMYQGVTCQKATGLKSDAFTSGQQCLNQQQIDQLIKEHKSLVETLEKNYDSNKIVKVSFDENDQSIIQRIQEKINQKSVYK